MGKGHTGGDVYMAGFLWEEGSEFPRSALGKGLVSITALQGK